MVSRRWVLFGITVVLLTYAAYLLGQWQFHRLADRESGNAVVRTNLSADPVPVAEVLEVGRPVGARDEWRRVVARGTYSADESVVIRYQTREGASGVDVVTPLRTAGGTSVLVDRGWLETANSGADTVDAPAPPEGEVTVTGWVRADATGRAATVTDRSARAVSSEQIAPTLDGPVYGGFVDLEKESPAASEPLARTELPDLGNGPHFFYGLQWWFFGLLALVGFCYLAFDEWRRQGTSGGIPHRDRSMPPSTGSITPDTNPAAGESRKAAALPNSSGRP